MPTIAKQLGVRHVLEGSVRRSGTKVRITAQLIDACEDRHLWSDTYDRELQDIFEVQDEIANHIFTALKLTLTVAEEKAIHSTTDSVDALDCYLRGRDLYHRTNPGHLDRSREKFEEALRIDPQYALAWAGLTYIFVDTYWYREKEKELLQRASQSSMKAVELAPHLAESHSARGLALRVNENFPEAEAEFEKAMELNPNLFEPIHFYAQMARSLGQYEKAAMLFLRAADVRPEDYQALAIASNMYDILGKLALSLDTCREALERVKRAVELNPTDSRALILGAGIMQQIGDDDAVIDWMARADRAFPDSPSVAYNSACIYAKYGDAERALDFLEKAVSLGSGNKLYFEHDPDFSSIEDHPRFRALLETL
jgi:tetratricopeptide (TPR) repeat protein